ncbi:radical SAM protein [Enterococcus rivorum]|uniref:Radical SAM protein n=3 Tax=Enterococcus rivorum TaxID=762845 RepID=A0A1E5KY88_9ENTE|nr:radical SAM protein [Enterococcus rivorum]
MEWIEAKSLLSKVSFNGDLWFGIDYIMNLYKGCNHRCIYCDSRSDKYFIESFDRVRGKKNSEGLLYFELKKHKTGVINFGAMSDAYNSEELREGLTRNALKKIAEFGYGISIETKSNQIIRDVGLIQKIQENHSASIKLSITTADDKLSRIIEPGVCVSSKRFEAIRKLSDAGIYTGVLLTPVLPYITDTVENIEAIVKKASESGASFIYAQFGMTMRRGQREHYFEALDHHFPGLKERYQRSYGDNYGCEAKNSKELAKAFVENCEKYGLLYKMEDIVKATPKKKTMEQLSLFS